MKINSLPTPQTQQSHVALQKTSSSAKSQAESSLPTTTSTPSVGEQNDNDQDDQLSLSLTGLSSLSQKPTTASELTGSQASDLAMQIKQDFQNNSQASKVFNTPDTKAVISLLSSR